MSIHHLDTFRYLFGDPESVLRQRPAPTRARSSRTGTASCLYILEYARRPARQRLGRCLGGPAREGAAADIYINWRVEGTDGVAQGTIGWPEYPNAAPSTLRYAIEAQSGLLGGAAVERGLVPGRVRRHDGRADGRLDQRP